MLWIANMCHHAKFYQNWSNVSKDVVKVWIIHLFGMKMVICTLVTVLRLRIERNWFFLIFELAAVCLNISRISHPFSNFSLLISSGRRICFAMRNYIKIGQTSAKIRKNLNISLVWHANGYLRFFRCFGVKNRRKWKLSLVSSLYECLALRNFLKIGQTLAKIS